MFCRGDVMSRFVILEGLERDGTGARKNLDSFPDPAQVPGSQGPHQADCSLSLLGPDVVRLACRQHDICLSAYQSRTELLKEGNLIGMHARCREEDSAMSPTSDDSDPEPFSLFPLQSPNVSRAGNINNHDSRSDPTGIMQQRSLTLPKAQPKRPTGCPISFPSSTKGRAAPAKFLAADQRGESKRATGCSS